MNIPAHYRPFYREFIRMALVMLVFGGAAGVFLQEMTKSISYDDVGPGVRFEAIYHLAILHGHSFVIGTLMPIAWLMIMQISLRLGARPISEKSLRWIYWTYVPGAYGTIFLIAYKGVHYVQCVKGGETDFQLIHETLFGGSRLARGLAYGFTHTIASVGLAIFAVCVWRNLKRSEDS